jgi:hypothetical protein
VYILLSAFNVRACMQLMRLRTCGRAALCQGLVGGGTDFRRKPHLQSLIASG